MDLELNGLRVLVTAGAAGIGLAIARRFARGCRVHTCDVDEMALAALAGSDGAITATHCDVSDRAAVKKLFADAPQNSAASTAHQQCRHRRSDRQGRRHESGGLGTLSGDCLTGKYNCMRLAVPHWRRRNASIVNMSSAAGRLGFPIRAP